MWKNGLVLAVFALAWIGATATPSARGQDTAKFERHEEAFAATGQYSNPYIDLDADAELIGPDGSRRNLPLFWDGGGDWKFRFSPAQVGSWHWTLRSKDAGLNGRSGQFNVIESTRRGSIQPMKGHPCWFATQDGKPFWFMGDTAWALFIDIPSEKYRRDSAMQYIDKRAAEGFTVLHSMLLCEAGDQNENGPPFSSVADQKINPGYWQEVDRRLAYANDKGLVVGLALAWASKRGTEPYAWKQFPSLEARQRYARYIAARYGAFDVYFLVSGEWNAAAKTTPGATEYSAKQEFIAIGDALKQADVHGRMIGIHPMTHHGSSREFVGTSWMSFGDYQQNYRQLHDRVVLSRQASLPVVNSEYAYHLRDSAGDGVVDKSNSFSIDDIRDATWDIAMGGGSFVTGFGTTYFGGRRAGGSFDLNAAKNKDWEQQVQYLRKFFTSFDWWKLIPADLLVTAKVERGQDREHKADRNGKKVAVEQPPAIVYWAPAQPGERYVIYVRGTTDPVTLALDAAGGSYRARQFNPRTGEFVDRGSSVVRDRFEYRPPDTGDWVLLLEHVTK